MVAPRRALGDDRREKFTRILGCVNKLNIRNDKVLVQELGKVPRTDDLWTSLGSVVLATINLRRSQKDVAMVLEIEAGLIVV